AAARAGALRVRLLGLRAPRGTTSRRAARTRERSGALEPRPRTRADAAAQRRRKRGRGARLGGVGLRRRRTGETALARTGTLMPLITVSRQYGSGGSEVAERVATALGWQLYDNAVVDEVARRLGMSTEEVSAREERVPSLPERFASAMALGLPEVMPTVADLAAQPHEERIVAMTKRVIEDAVQAGPAVLVGRGAQC